MHMYSICLYVYSAVHVADAHLFISSLGGSFQHIKWDREGTKEIVIYTTTEGVHYCGLYELFTKVLNLHITFSIGVTYL